ncbi:UNVERIFIED_CONTAM: hypothetical protein Scaly_0333700 [Sesamum calycinum]|uniref:ZNF598/HEL2 C2H2 zinc finger domain-containing protein n=1 Tax=Sesamum calycinum TaxID=2727403 RepID=A0AAW2SB96_9LAMI
MSAPLASLASDSSAMIVAAVFARPKPASFLSLSERGRVGQYWYHEDTQALFDDLDHYKMIKAMCRLSCSVCDKMEDQQDDSSRRRAKFRNIEQLKGHLFHKHRLLMCSLCLEGRKMHFRRDHFLCEDEGCLGKKFIVFQSEAELKIPTSFRYRRSSEQENRRGRARTFLRDPSDSELSLAIQASLETASAAPSSSRATTDHAEVTDVESLIPPLDSIGTTDSEPPSRYLQALSQRSRSGALVESSFPPLPVASSSNQNPHPDVVPRKLWLHISAAKATGRATAEIGPASSSYLTSAQARPASNSSFAGSLVSSRTSGSTGRISHSSSAPNLSEREFLESSSTDFPPVSAAQTHKSPAADQALKKVDDVHTANKSLVEKMRVALGFDEDNSLLLKTYLVNTAKGLWMPRHI